MRYPKLVRKEFCKTPCEVTIYGELNENGEHEKFIFSNLFCNFQSKNYTTMTNEQVIHKVQSKVYFHEDFCPQIDIIENGFVFVNNNKHKIASGQKAYNPDGSVNYVCLDLE
jgi:hypothetical protein